MKNFFIFFIFFCFLGLGVFLWHGIYSPKDQGVADSEIEEKLFFIEKGQGIKEISLSLEKQGLIRWAPIFQVYALISGVSRNLQAGNYYLSPSMNIPEIAEKFAKGDIAKEKITIIEGWNLRDIGLYLENRGMFPAEEFWSITGFPLNPESLEGFLFPDTYRVRKGESPKEIVSKMRDNFEKKLTPDLRKEITGQQRTIPEIITMASLLEKEVRTKQDKKLVSGILWKRLKIGMPLQVDATIAYILMEDDWTFEQMLKEIGMARTIDSPYNTYLHLGLPPGPISNPGFKSILAAIYPKESQYWYYLSTPEGETIFSRTLQEHNIAKFKYLK